MATLVAHASNIGISILASPKATGIGTVGAQVLEQRVDGVRLGDAAHTHVTKERRLARTAQV